MIKITVKDGDVSFRAEGMSQAVHYALTSPDEVRLIVNNGKTKEITLYRAGKPVKRKSIPA